MSRILRFACLALASAAALTGCMVPAPVDGGLSDDDLNTILAAFNADVSAEGQTVSESEVRDALGDDADLIAALLTDLKQLGYKATGSVLGALASHPWD